MQARLRYVVPRNEPSVKINFHTQDLCYAQTYNAI